MRIIAMLILFVSVSFSSFAAETIGIGGYTAADIVLNRDKVKQILNDFKHEHDHRQIYDKYSDEFLETYGKLMINGVHKCTANIVSDDRKNDSFIVTTAEHCFKEGDEENRISVEFTKRDGTIITRNLSMITKNSEYDYAILRLDDRILNSDIKPLMISEYDYDNMLYEIWLIDEEPQITFGGYSADNFKGDGGKNLTYDQGCEIFATGRGYDTSTNCIAYPGASGGAFVVSYNDEDEIRQDLFLGVNKSISFDAYDKENPIRADFVDHSIMYDDLMAALGRE